MSFIINIPLKAPLPSAANLREFWATKAKRVKAQRGMTRLAFMQPCHPIPPFIRTKPTGAQRLHARLDEMLTVGWNGPHSLRVRFIRIAPRKLDDDNLAHAFKAIRDEVAAMAGVDDGDSLWRWEYAQEKGKPGIRIEVGG